MGPPYRLPERGANEVGTCFEMLILLILSLFGGSCRPLYIEASVTGPSSLAMERPWIEIPAFLTGISGKHHRSAVSTAAINKAQARQRAFGHRTRGGPKGIWFCSSKIFLKSGVRKLTGETFSLNVYTAV